MIIGLLDYDLITKESRFPNLELMKLSSYYKSHRDTVELIRDCRDFMIYDKIYLRKEEPRGSLPYQLIAEAKNKIEYGGRFFSKQYKPFTAEIEMATPDKLLYDLKWVQKKQTPTFKTAINSYTCLRTDYCDLQRLVSEKQRYLLYDDNIASHLIDFTNFIYRVKKRAKKIRFVNPVIVNSLEDLNVILKWGELIYSDNIYEINTKPSLMDIKNNLLLYTGRVIYVNVFDEKYRNISLENGYALIRSEFNYLRTLIKEYGLYCSIKSFENNKLNQFIGLLNKSSIAMAQKDQIESQLPISMKSFLYRW